MELDKKKILTFAVIFSIIGISVLYGLTAQTSSRNKNIAEIDEELLGTRISTEGIISDTSWFRFTVLFELRERDFEESLTVATDRDVIEDLDGKEELIHGARVSVEGKLEEYEGNIQLNIDDQGRIDIEEGAYSDFTPISDILENPNWYEGMEVKIQGDIIDIERKDQGLYLTIADFEDENYRIHSLVEEEIDMKNPIRRPAVIEGRVIYNSNTGVWFIYSSSPIDIK